MGTANITYMPCKVAHFKLVLPLLLVVICYIPVLNAPFVWDDDGMIVNNPLIRSWNYLDDIFSRDAFGGRLVVGAPYRPVQIVSYLVDYHIWGLRPFGFRLTNLVIHCLSVVVLCRLLLELGFLARVVLWTSLIFAIHPFCIESITYISGRGDALFLLFGLLSFWMFCKGSDGRFWWYIPGWLLFGLSILAKENGLPIPLSMALAIIFLRKTWRTQQVFAGLAGFLAIIAGFLWFRFVGLPPASKETLSAIAHASLSERLLTLPYMLFTYVQIVLLPHNLHMEYHHVITSPWDPYVLLGFPLMAILFWLSYKLFERVGAQKVFLFLMGWFLVGLGPVYQVLVPLASTVREHWLYLPGIGLIGILAMAGLQITEMVPKLLPRWTFTAFGVAYLCFLGATTLHRNLDWTDEKRLYSHDLALEPNSLLLHNNLGVMHLRERNIAQAKMSFKNALGASPNGHYDVAHNNLGVAYLRENNTAKAEAQFIQSIEHGRHAPAYLNLAGLYFDFGFKNKAFQVLKDAQEAHPDHAGVREFSRQHR